MDGKVIYKGLDTVSSDLETFNTNLTDLNQSIDDLTDGNVLDDSRLNNYYNDKFIQNFADCRKDLSSDASKMSGVNEWLAAGIADLATTEKKVEGISEDTKTPDTTETTTNSETSAVAGIDEDDINEGDTKTPTGTGNVNNLDQDDIDDSTSNTNPTSNNVSAVDQSGIDDNTTNTDSTVNNANNLDQNSIDTEAAVIDVGVVAATSLTQNKINDNNNNNNNTDVTITNIAGLDQTGMNVDEWNKIPPETQDVIKLKLKKVGYTDDEIKRIIDGTTTVPTILVDAISSALEGLLKTNPEIRNLLIDIYGFDPFTAMGGVNASMIALILLIDIKNSNDQYDIIELIKKKYGIDIVDSDTYNSLTEDLEAYLKKHPELRELLKKKYGFDLYNKDGTINKHSLILAMLIDGEHLDDSYDLVSLIKALDINDLDLVDFYLSDKDGKNKDIIDIIKKYLDENSDNTLKPDNTIGKKDKNNKDKNWDLLYGIIGIAASREIDRKIRKDDEKKKEEEKKDSEEDYDELDGNK